MKQFATIQGSGIHGDFYFTRQSNGSYSGYDLAGEPRIIADSLSVFGVALCQGIKVLIADKQLFSVCK